MCILAAQMNILARQMYILAAKIEFVLCIGRFACKERIVFLQAYCVLFASVEEGRKYVRRNRKYVLRNRTQGK